MILLALAAQIGHRNQPIVESPTITYFQYVNCRLFGLSGLFRKRLQSCADYLSIGPKAIGHELSKLLRGIAGATL
jgi:hypothetical protein